MAIPAPTRMRKHIRTYAVAFFRVTTPRFCPRQHGTYRSCVYGFSALRAEKPYTIGMERTALPKAITAFKWLWHNHLDHAEMGFGATGLSSRPSGAATTLPSLETVFPRMIVRTIRPCSV